MHLWAPMLCILVIFGSNITYYSLWGALMISLSMHTNMIILEWQKILYRHGKTWYITPTETLHRSASICDWINYLCIWFLQKLHDVKTTTSLMLPQFPPHHSFFYPHTNPQVNFIYQSVVLFYITCSVLHCFFSLSLHLTVSIFLFHL